MLCEIDYRLVVYIRDNLKIIRFLGIKPDNCFCRIKYAQKIIFDSNKNLLPSKLYFKHPDKFKNIQEISTLKHEMECPINC